MKKVLLGAVSALVLLAGCATHDATKCESFKEVFKQNKVYFALNKAELTPEDKQVLNEQIKWLKEHPTKKIIVQGYTDPTGTPAHNMKLGKMRAEAVKEYYMQNNINPDRIRIISFGEQDLVSAKNTPETWPHDRRAVSVIVTE